jgi:hypothetical protein
VAILELHPEHCVGERFADGSILLYVCLLRQSFFVSGNQFTVRNFLITDYSELKADYSS